MNTSDLFKINRSSRRLNEGLHRAFGKKINLEAFTLDKLHDARNKLRTQVSQIKSNSSFNENLENDAYHQAQWMLDAINAEIDERNQYIIDTAINENQEGDYEDQVQDLMDRYRMGEVGEDEFLDELEEIQNTSSLGEGKKNYNFNDDDIRRIFMITDLEELRRESIKLLTTDSTRPIQAGKVDHFKNAIEKATRPEQIYSAMANLLLSGEGNRTISSRKSAYHRKFESQKNLTTGDKMKYLKESEIQQASTIVTAKTMVDRVGRWIEELSGMENDTLLQLGDSIRDEIGQEESKQFISSVAPAIQQALENLKTTRETLANSVHALAGGEAEEMLGADPEGDSDLDDAGELDDLEDMGDMSDLDGMDDAGDIDDAFAAADAAAGGSETAGREKRESINRENDMLRVLAG